MTMSGRKMSLNISKFTQTFDINQIRPELRNDYERIMYHIQHPILFDPDLNHRQRMFLLYQPGAIKIEFLIYLYDCIHTFNISEDLRDSLFTNLNEISEDLIPIDMYSGRNQNQNSDDFSTEDTNTQSSSNNDSKANDTSHDLQNPLRNETDYQSNFAAFHPTPVNNRELSNNHTNENGSKK